MKMKKFFSGFLATIMSVAVIAAPVSIASADTNEKCTILINHAATSGTYTAYPIFMGNVEPELDDSGTETGRLVIDSPKFHSNLETTISSNQVAARADTQKYGLWTFLHTTGTKANDKTFIDMIRAYDPNTSFSSFSNIGGGTATSPSADAEIIANTLNLTSSETAVDNILNGTSTGTATSAFYSAFAEAARLFMIDNITDAPGTLTGTATATPSNGTATIEVDEPGYYLVEWTPADYNGNESKYENAPRAVRRSLVLVGKGDECKATINSKDTENITSVDIQFNKNILDKSTCEGDAPTYAYPADVSANADAEENWAKNVSAGNGDYVNCRVVVTLPSNLSVYDQYYLAVPIMYGYNVAGSSGFDYNKSITRMGDDVEVRLVADKIDGTTDVAYLMNNASDSAVDQRFKPDISDTYTYANDIPITGEDRFKAKEVFVINDLMSKYANLCTGNFGGSKLTDYVGATLKLTFTFPVKFERFSGDTLSVGASTGVSVTGYGVAGSNNFVYGDDALMKNYITAKAVYSNNPNLKSLKDGETAYDKTTAPDGVKLYLDTSKAPGSLPNPVGISKESSANIVTYRLRVHATTNDLLGLNQSGGVEGARFALVDNKTGKYAQVKQLGSYSTYDTVDGELIRDPNNTSNPNAPTNQGSANVYKITGWVEKADDANPADDCILKTYNKDVDINKLYGNNNSGRFEILGLAPGEYTLVALDENIKTADTYMSSVSTTTHNKDYKLQKDDGIAKIEYKFSFNPDLVDACTKLPYLTHYAPIGSTAASQPANSAVITNDNILIENFNMRWWKGTEEITDKPEWWLGQKNDVGLMSMRVTYVKKGLTLPVTGGIGTFIFFAVGGALVVISTVAIVTKFRVKRERL